MSNKNQSVQVNVPPMAAACVDGHQLVTNNNTGDTNMLFIQLYPHLGEEDVQQGIVVANVRLNITQLRQLGDSIGKTIETYEKTHPAS